MANEYGDHSNVEPYFKSLTLSGSTTFTDTEIDTWMNEIAREIDLRIAHRYTVPVTDSDAVTVLTRICSMIGAAQLKRAMNADEVTNSKTKKTEADILEENAYKMLEKIGSGESTLFSAGSSGAVVASYNVDNDKDPIFEKETDQW